MEGISLSYIHNKGSLLSLLGLPESFDICSELVHKFGGYVSILEDLFSPVRKSMYIQDKSTTVFVSF